MDVRHLGDVAPVLVVAGGLVALLRVRQLPTGRTTPGAPVAVVIPARDEAHSLPALLHDLRASDPPVDLVVVIDDGSRDGTADVARASAGVVVEPAPPLPEGWAGKPWACAHGAAIATCRLGPDATLVFLDADVRVEPRAIVGLVGARSRSGGVLSRIAFAGAPPLERRALFFTTGQYQRSDLLERLGCEFNEKGTVRTGKYETTHLPGLFVAGDASRAVQWVVVAASEGAEAAFAINTDLLKEDLR